MGKPEASKKSVKRAKRTSSGILKTSGGCIFDDTNALDSPQNHKKAKFSCEISPIEPKLNSGKKFPKDFRQTTPTNEYFSSSNSSSKKSKTFKTPIDNNFRVPAPKMKSTQKMTTTTSFNLNHLDDESIEISDYESDEDIDAQKDTCMVPKWARKANVSEAMKKQRRTDPDTIFGRMTGNIPQNLSTIYDGWTPKDRNKIKKRRQSANWTPDRLKFEEEENYKDQMGFDDETKK